ncbi:hypothetical protein [Actinopolyspora halophila]|uniref:hypothetical protein n=1 Tax=Actinopolyspora halophila TaxID=1850 RepID=UPI000376DD8A|nr:hypothetical protein [Actinopolyspora halophila]
MAHPHNCVTSGHELAQHVRIVSVDERTPAALGVEADAPGPRDERSEPIELHLDLRTGELSWEVGSHQHRRAMAHPRRVFWDGAIRVWDTALLHARAANTLLAELTPYAQQILDGASLHWDGNDEHVHLDESASAAQDHIDATVSEQALPDSARLWPEYLHDCYPDDQDELRARIGLTAQTPHDHLDEMVTAVETDAADYGLFPVDASDWVLDTHRALRTEASNSDVTT